jgi:hypothetical protein
MNTKIWFILMVVFAFVSFIAFVNVDSAFADEHNANEIYLATGIVSALCAIGSLYITYKSTKK